MQEIFSPIRPFWTILLLTSVFLLIDLLTKYLYYDLGRRGSLFYPLLNTGISWSFSLHMILIYIISLGGIACFLYGRWIGMISTPQLSLILAGTFGNLTDRILYAGVRDFIYLGFGPVFNVADILLFIGLARLCITQRKSSPH